MIDILLATYKPNAKYLQEQEASIRAQEAVRTNLIVHEDKQGEGACVNFSELMEMSKSEYVAFSDQDDVWRPDKLRKMLVRMRGMEAKYGKDAPLLVFCDSEVVDSAMQSTGKTFLEWSRLDARRVKSRQIILQNMVCGHAMLFNAALREKAKPIPSKAFMHDHWVTLVASVFGHISYLPEILVKYRQHGANVIGASHVNLKYFLMRLTQGRKALHERLYANIRQVEAFVERYGDAAPKCFHALVGLQRKPYLMRVFILIRYGIFKQGLLRNIGTWLVV